MVEYSPKVLGSTDKATTIEFRSKAQDRCVVQWVQLAFLNLKTAFILCKIA